MSKARFVFAAVHAASWLLLGIFAYRGFQAIPNEIFGGLYSNTDGTWAEWNASGILRYGNFLDLSPFNAFAGMGNLFAPNLPWLNPGALVLGLPLGRASALMLSYLAYALPLAISIAILGRALGFSWLTAAMAAQLHFVVFFPPFSHLFLPMEWYSAAPIYAYVSTLWNFVLALFLLCARLRSTLSVWALPIGAATLVMVGCYSAPFAFVFFGAPYLSLGALCACLAGELPRSRQRQLLCAAVPLAAVLLSGLVDYWLVTISNSARTPSAAIAWQSLLSPEAWRGLLRNGFCNDPRALVCAANHVAWFQVLGLVGAVPLIFFGRGLLQVFGLWTIAYSAAIHLYALPYQAGWLGPAGTISVHFLSWSSYCLTAVATAASIPAYLRLLFEALQPPRVTGLLKLFLILAIGLAAKHSAGYVSFKTAVDHARSTYASVFGVKQIPVREPVAGEISKVLLAEAQLNLGDPFRGYVATFWSRALNSSVTTDNIEHRPWLRYAYGRGYFATRYGNTFTEMDLWRWGIPTFEEYGQWVSRQSQAFALNALAGASDREAEKVLTFLRIYKLDVALMRALGIKYLITNEKLDFSKGLALRASEHRPDSVSVYLYEIRQSNTGNLSPVAQTATGTTHNTLARIASAGVDYNATVLVEKALPGRFVPARNAGMFLERDGYRVTAESAGRSMLVLPIQFSNCLVLRSNQGALDHASLRRANFIQTLLEFEGTVDVSIKLDFGIWKTACRRRDAEDIADIRL